MSNGRFIFRCFAVALLPFLSAITTAYAADPPAQQRPNTKALVAGSAEALADFDKKLLTYLKAESMAQANVGCTGCSAPQKDAVTQQPTRTYTFVQSSDIVGKVMAAWSDVKGKGVTLTFSDYKQPEPDCGPPKPQPCVTVKMIPSTKVLVNNQPVALLTPATLCQSVEQIPQGPPNAGAIQTRVLAL